MLQLSIKVTNHAVTVSHSVTHIILCRSYGGQPWVLHFSCQE